MSCFCPSQWLKIWTDSSSWRAGCRPSHLHAHRSLTGGVWSAVVPRWKTPRQRRQRQPGVRLATRTGGRPRQQQPVNPLLEWTPRSCQGERLLTWVEFKHLAYLILVLIIILFLFFFLWKSYSRLWHGVHGNQTSSPLEGAPVTVTFASGTWTVAPASVQ